MPELQLGSFTVNPFAENTYVIDNGEAAILFDPGFFNESDFSEFKNYLNTRELTLENIVLTHGHIDHVLGLNRVKQAYDVPAYMHEADQTFIDKVEQQGMMFGVRIQPIDIEFLPLRENANLKIGSFEFDARHVPGHAPGHFIFYAADAGFVIAGDTLFRESIGRTDLFQGDFELLSSSIKSKMYSLPEETVVYPGHGPETTIGHEMKHNPFVRG